MQRTLLDDLAALPRRRRTARPSVEALEQRLTPAPLVVSDLNAGTTAAQMVNTLTGTGSGVTVSNITFSGDNRQGGLFSGGNGVIGFENGIVIGTGSVNDVIGPNDDRRIATTLGGAGDADLDAIQTGTEDAAFLQFDFVTAGDTLTFDYVFTSDEYNEFVGVGVNDVFAFFLNGSNVALLPGTTTAVSIDTVNLTSNPSFYINNATSLSGETNPAAGPLLDTQMDGLTVVLSVQVTVVPGATNTIKLAIADVGDDDVDSNVFIRAGSFRSPPAPIFTAYRPFRYAFRELEQNLGRLGPLPIAGGASAATYDGLLTLLNTGDAPATGDFIITFRQLPPGASLLNASGISSNGDPFIRVSGFTLPEFGAQCLRVPVKFSNPGLASLGTFYVGPYFAEVDIA